MVKTLIINTQARIRTPLKDIYLKIDTPVTGSKKVSNIVILRYHDIHRRSQILPRRSEAANRL